MHGVSNRDTHLHPPCNNSLVHLTTAAYVRRSDPSRITNGRRSGWTTLRDSVLLSPTPAPTLLEWPTQEQPGSRLTASGPVSDNSAPACTNGVWLPLRPVSVAQKNKPSTMLSSNVQSIYLPMDCTAWQFWTMRQSNGCSTPAPRSSVAKWTVTTRSNEDRFPAAVRFQCRTSLYPNCSSRDIYFTSTVFLTSVCRRNYCCWRYFLAFVVTLGLFNKPNRVSVNFVHLAMLTAQYTAADVPQQNADSNQYFSRNVISNDDDNCSCGCHRNGMELGRRVYSVWV